MCGAVLCCAVDGWTRVGVRVFRVALVVSVGVLCLFFWLCGLEGGTFLLFFVLIAACLGMGRWRGEI